MRSTVFPLHRLLRRCSRAAESSARTALRDEGGEKTGGSAWRVTSSTYANTVYYDINSAPSLTAGCSIGFYIRGAIV